MQRSNILRRNNVHIFGEGSQTLVFAHGFGCDQQLWRFVAPAFTADYQVVLFDYVGAGGADPDAYDPVRYGTMEGYVLDVLEVLEAVGSGPVTFVGHSVSGMIGLLASIRRPELFRRLVLLCPSPYYLNEGPAYQGGFDRPVIDGLLDLMDKNPLGWAGFLAPMVMRNPGRPELTAELQAGFCAMKPEVARRFARITFLSDHRGHLPLAKVPALILQASGDLIAPDQVGAYLHRHLPGSTFQRLEATGHCPHVSHPEETIGAIRAYLSTRS